MLRYALPLSLALVSPAMAASPADLEAQIRAALANPALEGTRWGLQVEDKQGHVLASIAPDERFQPASNTKIFITTAVYDAMARGPFPNGGTQVRLEPGAHGRPHVVLVGRGDALLTDTPDCQRDCLATLADAVAATGIRRVGDVIGDDSFMPFERWTISEALRPGTRMVPSALTLNDNEITITAAPGPSEGAPASADMPDLAPEVALVNEVTTGPAGSRAQVHAEMIPGQRRIRLFGSLPLGGRSERLSFDVDDPADFAAIRFARLLRARGITVLGQTRPRHAPLSAPAMTGAPALPAPPALASLTPPPIAEDLKLTAKVSQNLHAHLFLRKLAIAQGQIGTTPAGLIALRQVLVKAGLSPASYDFYDGSGLSPDNRITPRAMVHYLHWADQQPWASQWRQDLPIGGVDGTLARRMRGTILQGRLTAKTGTLLATNALAGYVTAASGKELVFAIYASDRPSTAPSVLPTMDAALALIAAQN